jgi:serine/threonine-protein kinase
MKAVRHPVLAALAIVALVAGGALSLAPEAGAQSKSTADLAIAAQDVFTKYGCFKCHGDVHVRGDLNLRQLDKLLADKSQKILLPRTPRDSLLMQRVDDGTMPKTSTLPRVSPAEVKILLQWIAAGAPSPAEKVVEKVVLPLKQDVPAVNVTEVLRSRCASCHGGSKPESGLRIFNHAKLLKDKQVLPNDAAHSPLYQRLVAEDDNVMPPPGGGRTRLAPEEIAAVKTWIDSGAPPLETFVASTTSQRGDDYVLGAILKDVRVLKDGGKQTNLVRYFSFNHLLAQEVTAEGLEAHLQALTLILNHLSSQKEFERPQPIEETKTVFRVDISKLGWDVQAFKRIDTHTRKESGPSALNVFDLVLLEYPYAAFWEGSETYQKLLDEFLEPAHQVAPVPFIRGDWFINAAARPPLYEDMLQLPFSLEKLEKRLGVNSQAGLDNFTARRGGITDSGISKNNRVVERHSGRNTPYYWKSYDFNSSRGVQNMFRDPIDFNYAGGEMVWALPNGLQGYLLTNKGGTRLDAAPTEIVTDPLAADKVVRNGLSCMRCHEAGMRTFRDDVRPALDSLTSASPGFDLIAARKLYPEQKELDALLQQDARHYQDAVKKLFDGKPPKSIKLVLDQTSARFMDRPVAARAALAELGFGDPDREQSAFASRKLTTAGLVALAYGGAVRRDAWEDFYDQVVREARQGKPLVPLDGISKHEYQTLTGPDVTLEIRDARTNKKKKVLAPDDEVVIVIANRSKGDLFIDLIGTSINGYKVVLAENLVVAAGKEHRIPRKIKGNLGKESLTIYASAERLPPLDLVRLSETVRDAGSGMQDRVVHAFYKLKRTRSGWALAFDPASVVKKTVEFVTE